MKDVSFQKLVTLKKYKDLFDLKSIECVVALISSVLVGILLVVWNFCEDCNEIVNSLLSLIDGIGIALIGFLGFIVTGLAILTGAISSKIVKRLQSRNKMQTLERILLSFYLLGIVSAFIILLSLTLHFIIELPINTQLFLAVIVAVLYSYFTIFSIFYAVKLIGNCLELFIIINEMQIATEENNSKYKARYNEYRLMALEKLGLSRTSIEAVESYKKCIEDLIVMDDTDGAEKAIYFSMLKKQFDE